MSLPTELCQNIQRYAYIYIEQETMNVLGKVEVIGAEMSQRKAKHKYLSYHLLEFSLVFFQR